MVYKILTIIIEKFWGKNNWSNKKKKIVMMVFKEQCNNGDVTCIINGSENDNRLYDRNDVCKPI